VQGTLHADDAGAGHRRVLEQRSLDLLRADVRAVVDDDLLLAAAKPKIAVRIGAHHVTGIQSAVDERRGGVTAGMPISVIP
jgi:hypothetical protein